MSKFHNRIVRLDGYTFQSQLEADRYCQLKLLVAGGEISDLKVHPKWTLDVNGIHIANYLADFSYVERGEMVVADTKGVVTELFRMKARLMLAIWKIKIHEVTREMVG